MRHLSRFLSGLAINLIKTMVLLESLHRLHGGCAIEACCAACREVAKLNQTILQLGDIFH